jgi:hypothetical protein
MSSIEHQMTEIYCFVDDYLKAHPGQARWGCILESGSFQELSSLLSPSHNC